MRHDVDTGAHLTGRLHRHRHTVLWCRRGSLVVTCSGVSHVVRPGSALLVPAGTRHAVETGPGAIVHPVFLPARAQICDPVQFGVDGDLAVAMLGLSVAGTTELRPGPARLAELVEIVELAARGERREISRDVIAFIPWVVNPPGTYVLLYAVIDDSTVVLRAPGAEETVVDVPHRMALSIPPGVEHRVVTDRDAVCLPVFHDEVPGHAAVALIHLPPPLRVVAERHHMATTSALRPAGWDPGLLARSLAECSQRALVLTVQGEPGPVERIRQQILRDPGERVDLDAWAAAAGCSRRTLERDFRRLVGCSVLEWHQQVRSARAAELLEAGHQAKWVARHLGFRHQSAFSRSFRSAHGLSPRDYLAQAGTG